ncbi:Eco57I restriction-modification methylase domain-containing protein [Corynebacterium pilosum]|nr:class I SAM-dependent methyltransferase [Corynebacterium pilosum]
MKTKDQVSAEKLRGGFYSPRPLVEVCIERSARLLGSRSQLRVLEPSSGDGAFIRGLGESILQPRIDYLQAVEIDPAEAQKSADALESSGLPGDIRSGNVLEWHSEAPDRFDLVVGNPPYVRYQFIDEADRRRASSISSDLSIPGTAVSNLWIPVLLLSLSRLSEGGVFSFILPTEFLTGISASRVRGWLIRNTSDLHIDLFAPQSFPDVLQEVAVVTGRRTTDTGRKTGIVEFFDHNGGLHEWRHSISVDSKTWTSYLLSPQHNQAVKDALSMQDIVPLSEVAKFSVSTVTGANKYFCVSTEVAEVHHLQPWLVPLLPRTRHAPGLIFSAEEHELLASTDIPSWLLDFAPDKPAPTDSILASLYIQKGEDENLHTRYKTRIRSPWYRVPLVTPGELMLAKRSNRYPRMIVNQAKAFTTDTIYRGQVLPTTSLSAEDIAASFHNSLTLLSAEIEGRSFGGGVLELVPSEISSLSIPVTPGAGKSIDHLDKISRTAGTEDDLVEATDALMPEWLPEMDFKHMELIHEARLSLLNRRLERN